MARRCPERATRAHLIEARLNEAAAAAERWIGLKRRFEELLAIGAGNKTVDARLGMTVDDPCQDVAKLGKRVDVIELAGLGQRRRLPIVRHHRRIRQKERLCD